MSSPPASNRGGTSRQGCSTAAEAEAEAKGVGVGAGEAQKTIIDTISYTFGAERMDDCHLAERCAKFVLENFPQGTIWADPEPGKHSYRQQRKLMKGSLVCGWLAYDAKHGRPWLYLTGMGCRTRRDHGLPEAGLASFMNLPGAKLTRCDIALDVYSHKEFSVAKSLSLAKRKKYTLPKSPSDPSENLVWSSTRNPDYPRASTHYIGQKSSGKRLRVYDKGLEQLHGLKPEQLKKHKRGEGKNLLTAWQVPEGRRIEEWTRVELEYTDNDRILTPDMITCRDAYFAGAYPPLAKLLKRSDGLRPKYIGKEEDFVFAVMLENLKIMFGGFVYHALDDLKIDPVDFCGMIKADKRARRIQWDRETPSGGEQQGGCA